MLQPGTTVVKIILDPSDHQQTIEEHIVKSILDPSDNHQTFGEQILKLILDPSDHHQTIGEQIYAIPDPRVEEIQQKWMSGESPKLFPFHSLSKNSSNSGSGSNGNCKNNRQSCQSLEQHYSFNNRLWPF